MRMDRSLQVYFVLTLLAVVGLCASAITATEIVSLGPFVFPCSNIIFSLLTFPVTDIVSEIYGKRFASRTVWIAFGGQALFVGLIQMSVLLPAATTWNGAAAYTKTLGTGPRILCASLVAFLSSQLWDVFVYARLKRLCRGRLLWLRNNVSTFTSQLINSALFVTIAFAGTTDIAPLILGSIALKWIIALVDTPLVYLGVYVSTHLIGRGHTIAFTAAE